MSTLTILLPLVLCVCAGFVSMKQSIINDSWLNKLRGLIFNIAIPIFLFTGMYKANLDQVLSANLLASFYVPVIAVYAACLALTHALFKVNTDDAALLALASTYSNTVVVGLPIIIASLGASHGALVFMIITFHSALLFSFTFFFAMNKQLHWISALKPLLLNPIVVSISLGLMCNLIQLPLPSMLIATTSALAYPVIYSALFVLGASLTNYAIKQAWRTALYVSLIKLIVLPLCVYTLAKWGLNLPHDQIAVVTLMSASPLGVNAYLVARQLKRQQAILASSVALSTILSALTLAAWLSALIP
jgi:predicted permease